MVVIVFIIIMGIILVRLEYWLDFMLYGFIGVLVGFVIVFFVFVGFDVIVIVGEEVKNLSRMILFLILFVLIVCFLVYFGVLVVVMLIWFYDKLDYGVVLLKVFEYCGVNFVKYIIVVGVFCGMIVVINGGFFLLFCLLYVMVFDGLIFKSFVFVSKRIEVLYIGIFFLGIFVGILVMVFEL